MYLNGIRYQPDDTLVMPRSLAVAAPEPPLMITIEALPLTAEQLRGWLTARGVSGGRLASMLREYAGCTLDEMEALHDAQHGSMA